MSILGYPDIVNNSTSSVDIGQMLYLLKLNRLDGVSLVIRNTNANFKRLERIKTQQRGYCWVRYYNSEQH